MKLFTLGIELDAEKHTITFELDHSDFFQVLALGLKPYTQLTIGDHTDELTTALKALIREHEGKLSYGFGSSDLSEQIRQLFRQYEHTAADAIMDAQHFQTDVALWLQGLALCCQMVSNGATHTEKNARMRGLVEMIESALGKVREFDYKLSHFNRRSYRPDDLFVNDYPVRHFKERAENAERELDALKKRLIEKPQEVPAGNDDTQADFKF